MYLGIDQSLTGTGLCLLDENGDILSCETVNTGRLTGVKRINAILEAISRCLLHPKLIQSLDDPRGPNFYVVIEGYSYASNSNSAYQIGELGGCIRRHIFLFSQQYPKTRMFSLPPTTVKKFCLGKGTVKKDCAYLYNVYEEFKIKFEDDNQADAFMLARTIRAMQLVCYEPGIISDLSTPQKDSLIPKGVRKRKKITEKKYKELEDEEIADLLRQAMNSGVYGVF
jgi:Holliday junction resolvasome RuvABC endonuclease subunit